MNKFRALSVLFIPFPIQMAENKTRPTNVDVISFLETIQDPVKKRDSQQLIAIMEELTGHPPRMWGSSIVGFGTYRYKYASGREGDWFLCGFSPRKQSLVLYIMGYLENYSELLSGLGKHKHGKGCLYINRLEQVDVNVLRKLIIASIERMKERKDA